MLMRYKNFIGGQLSQLEYKDIPALDEKEWKQFGFAEVFDIKKGFYNKKPEADGTGTIPFLGATGSNNGVTHFLTLEEIEHGTKTGDLNNSPLEKKLFPGRAIAVTNNGSVGHAKRLSLLALMISIRYTSATMRCHEKRLVFSLRRLSNKESCSNMLASGAQYVW